MGIKSARANLRAQICAPLDLAPGDSVLSTDEIWGDYKSLPDLQALGKTSLPCLTLYDFHIVSASVVGVPLLLPLPHVPLLPPPLLIVEPRGLTRLLTWHLGRTASLSTRRNEPKLFERVAEPENQTTFTSDRRILGFMETKPTLSL